MILYKVYYKKRFFWHQIENVKGDYLLKEHPAWVFHLEDETIIQIPLDRIIKFSKERHYSIKERMSEEAGQETKTNPR